MFRLLPFKNNSPFRSFCLGLTVIAVLTFVSMFSAQQVYSAQATVSWNVDTGVAGYKVYYGQSSGNYTSNVDAGNTTTYTIQNLSDSAYYIAVAAYNSSNVESSLSPELAIQEFTSSAGSGGSISPSGSIFASQGASKAFTIAPATGYQVASVLVDGVSVGSVTSFTFSNVTSNHTISATFASNTSNTYTITPTAGPNGTISPSGAVSVPAGASERFTISPAAHYRISNVSVDGKSLGPVVSHTFNKVAANHTIAATFALSGRFQIRASAQGGGSISPAEIVKVPAGTNRSFTIRPVAGHSLTSVLVDGVPISTLSGGVSLTGGGLIRTATTYVFANVVANHSITAVFSKIPPPVADAGPDQIIQTGSTVTLNGSNSTDTLAGIASCRWTQVSGPRVALSNPSAPVCSFTAPNGSSGKLLTFKLVVSNNGGIKSSDSCFVNVCAGDAAPLANAGPGQTVSPYTNVTLNGSGSSDADGTIASYKWIQISGPKLGIQSANTSQPSFVAPNVGSLGASLVFQLQVADQFGLTTTDQCTVNVINADQPPVANAGSKQTAVAASTVTLDGSGSQDPNGSSVTYRWKQIRGVPVTLSDPSAATPVFTAPSDAGTDLLFMLTVTDAASQLSATAECTVTIASQ